MACLVAAALVLVADRATAQGYPRTIRLPQDDTVLVYNRTIFDRGPAARPAGRRVDYVYGSFLAASDSVARHQQADRAAQVFGREAAELGVRLLSIGLCDTRACAAGRSPPAAWYLYELGATGWRRLVLR